MKRLCNWVTRLLIASITSALLMLALRGMCTVSARSSPSAITVTNTNDSGPGSLRAALAAASAGDVVQFSLPASSTIVLTNGELSVNAPMTIDGSTALSLTVSGNHASRVLLATAPLTIRALTIADGNVSGDGGGISATDALTLTGVRVVDNLSGGAGGGVFVGGPVTLMDSLFRDNSSQYSGGGLRAQSSLEMTGTLFLSNTTRGLAGGAFALGAARLSGGSFQDNTANYSGGGGLYAYDSLEITGTTFLSNTVYGAGGGVFAEGTVRLNGGLFQNNGAAGFGGGLAGKSSADIKGTQFVSNSAGYDGGGADILGTVTLHEVLFQDNRANNSGGGLHAWTAYLTATQFLSNGASFGGGMISQGAASLTDGRFQANRARLGGGLFTESIVKLSETEFLGNLATLWGGGVYHSANSAGVINSLFVRNSAPISGSAIYLGGSTGNVQIYHTTIGAPSTTSSSAVVVEAGTVEVKDTIIVSHTVGLDNVGGVVVQDYNLFWGNGTDTTGSVSGGEHNAVGDPYFVDVAHDDYHLGLGSAAIDAGVDVGVTRDFDGDLRPDGSGFDIGFDEQFRNTRFLFLPLISKR